MTQTDATDSTTPNYGGTLVVNPDHIVTALKWNDTPDADNRVIRSFRPFDGDDIKTDIRHALQGSERYPNPDTAPLHIRPEQFLPESDRTAFAQLPDRGETALNAPDVPTSIENRSDADEDRLDELHEEVLSVWEADVRNMLVDELTVGGNYPSDIDELRFDVRYEADT